MRAAAQQLHMHQNILMRRRGCSALSQYVFYFHLPPFPLFSSFLFFCSSSSSHSPIPTFILPFYLLFLISCPFPSLSSCLNSSALLLSCFCHLVSSLSLPRHLVAFHSLTSFMPPLFFLYTSSLLLFLSLIFRIYFTFFFLYLLYSSFFIFRPPIFFTHFYPPCIPTAFFPISSPCFPLLFVPSLLLSYSEKYGNSHTSTQTKSSAFRSCSDDVVDE